MYRLYIFVYNSVESRTFPYKNVDRRAYGYNSVDSRTLHLKVKSKESCI